LRFLLRFPPSWQGLLTITAWRGSHRIAGYQHATVPLRPLLTVVVLSFALLGLATKAFIPAIVDDFWCRASVDPGSATTDDTNDDGKPSPDDDSTTCKFGDFAKAILVTVDLALSHSLIPVHSLVVCDAATEPLLPDHFLPNAETGPPADIATGATTVSHSGWLLGTVGTVTRSCGSPHASVSHPQQKPSAPTKVTPTILSAVCDSSPSGGQKMGRLSRSAIEEARGRNCISKFNHGGWR
jgi:hypothetical protein